MALPDEVAAPLLDESRFVGALDALPIGMARQFHACTHTTIAPTVVHGGTKTNVIPDTATSSSTSVRCRARSSADVRRLIDEALGDLAERVEIVVGARRPVDRLAGGDAAVGLRSLA